MAKPLPRACARVRSIRSSRRGVRCPANVRETNPGQLTVVRKDASATKAGTPFYGKEKAMREFKCARCGKHVSQNVYHCGHCDWYICWDCIKKATFTNKLKCPKCGH